MVAVKKTTARASADKKSVREQLETLMENLKVEQEAAIKETQAYFASEFISNHLSFIEKMGKSAVPNDVFDTLMKNNITVINATSDWLTQYVNNKKLAAADTSSQQP